MGREIKFRAWDKETKRMFDVQLLQFFGKENNLDACWTNGVDFDGETTLEKGPNLNNLKNLILLQYTGLNDQFNTEIYEGDVVRHDFMVYEGHGSVGEDSTIDIIKNLTELPFGSSSIGCEVIGNIYENPELLQKEETN